MNVPDFEAGPVPTQATWPQCRKAPLMREFGKRVGLVHELAQLRTTEEVAHDSTERFRIDKLLRSNLVHAGIEKGHPLADETFGAGESHPTLISQELRRCARDGCPGDRYRRSSLSLAEFHQIFHGGDKVILYEDPFLLANLEP